MDDIALRFASRQDLHQSVLYSRVMERFGWSSIPVGDHRLFVRQIGPVSVAKLQRPGAIDVEQLLTLRKKLSIVKFLVEPGLQSTPRERDALANGGFHDTGDYYAHSRTAVTDIQGGPASFLRQMTPAVRSKINKGQRDPLSYTITRMDQIKSEQLTAFFAGHATWSRERSIIGYSDHFLRLIMEEAHDQGYLIEGAIEGTRCLWMIVLIHDRVASYFYTFGDRNAYEHHMPSGMVYQAIKVACDHGCDLFDWYSLYDDRYPTRNPRWKGFSTFKSRFHPKIIDYPRTLVRGIF